MMRRSMHRSCSRRFGLAVLGLTLMMWSTTGGAGAIALQYDDHLVPNPDSLVGGPVPACRDRLDNDSDGRTDYPNDTGCTDADDGTESPNPQCSDGVDNDGDGWTDYPNDPGCDSQRDTSEDPGGGICDPVAGVVVCIRPTSTVAIDQPLEIVSTAPGPSHTVAAYLDAYKFTLPGGIVTTLPCVTLVADTQMTPCASAGGSFVSRSTLVTQTVGEPDVVSGPVIARVRVCNAVLTATVNGFGVNSAPAFTIC